ncbi:hypothetical protein [Pyrococcus horikoshii]|uniref:hypothetical protein n=1 Tax=Pyrococcus horikoshii TaxID=53953 RepID=UPI002F35B608
MISTRQRFTYFRVKSMEEKVVGVTFPVPKLIGFLKETRQVFVKPLRLRILGMKVVFYASREDQA